MYIGNPTINVLTPEYLICYFAPCSLLYFYRSFDVNLKLIGIKSYWYCGFIYLRLYQFSWIENKIFSWISNLLVLAKSVYIPLQNLLFVEHLNFWFSCTHEIHENWYPTNINESTATYICIILFVFSAQLVDHQHIYFLPKSQSGNNILIKLGFIIPHLTKKTIDLRTKVNVTAAIDRLIFVQNFYLLDHK